MIISGSFTEIENNLNRYLRLFKESVLVNNNYTVKLTISVNGRSFIIVDKNTLREIDNFITIKNEADLDVYVIDEEIYHLLREGRPDVREMIPMSYENCENKTDKEKHKTGVTIAKTAQRDIGVITDEKTKVDTLDLDSVSPVSVLGEEYCIEDYLEESARLCKPCAFGVKYINDNIFVLYYRKAIYDKGADTTFRHYLCKQPGTLVAYRYFKELKSLRYQFETLGRKLRHNGQNILSKVQTDYLVHYFTKCWI